MLGIVSFGGYIPRLRLNRMSVYQSVGWFAPAIVMVAQGERSFCNWDEDSVTMAVAAARDCLKGVDKNEVDGVYLGSTTLPFSDRSNAGIVKTALNLRDDIVAQDFTSSLKAGTSALITALSAVKSGDRKNILVTATDKREAKTAYFYELWFGDGAASILIGNSDKVVAEFLGSNSISYDFVDHYRGAENRFDYMWEERWVRDAGYSKIVPEAVEGLFDKLSITMDDVDKFIFPCFFKAEHRKIANKLGAAGEKLVDNMHEVCGETGAAHPLVMLSSVLEKASPGDRILLAGFGQGCDALYFRVTDKIKNIPSRQGVNGSLANKKVEESHTKFLKFRDLLPTEMGIRAEAPTQTAMTTLWRKRKMILGLMGGKCEKCGTPQFPKMDICVNPNCLAAGAQVDYEFADMPAKVKTFTGDLLAVSVDPPSIYGMVQFDDGGRLMADFTDCEIDQVYVGQPLSMSFRRKYVDKQRGFSGYFWKAVPVPGEKPKRKPADRINFKGKVAVVTGAGAGLGRVYALELAKLGAKVVVNDLGGASDGSGSSTKAADKVVKQIKELGGKAVPNYDSVSTVEGGQGIIDTAIDAFGQVDILINNAGILRDKTLAKMTQDEWKAVLGVHLDGAYNVTRPAFIKMREKGYGRIVFTTSAAGLHGNFGQTNYSAAKLGLVGFANTLKIEGERHNIKANIIAPIALTRLTEDILPPDLKEKMGPEFVAPMILYLCWDKCGQSGQIFNAAMGYFNRSAIITGPGAVVGKGKKVPTVEDIEKSWDAINDMSTVKEYENATVALGAMLEAFNPKTEKAQSAPEKEGPSPSAVFENMDKAFQVDKAAGVDVVFQYKLTGHGGGEWNSVIKGGALEVNEGRHADPTTTIIMDAQDFIDMIGGKKNAMQLYTSGKLKIEGDLMKSQLIEKLFKF